MDDEEENKSGVCRVCLSIDKKKFMSLFEKYMDSLLCSYINAIANVEINEDDGLPDKICLDCLVDLQTAIDFKQKCERSNFILLSTNLNPLTENVEIDTEFVVKKEEIESDDDINFDSSLFDNEDNSLETTTLNKVDPDLLSLRNSKAIDLQLQCDDCSEFFKSKCKLRVHWKKVHLKDSLLCLKCKQRFKSCRAFYRHRQSDNKTCREALNFRIEGESKQRIFYCKEPECTYKSKQLCYIMKHAATHTGVRPFKCDLCLRTFTQYSSVQNHKESAHKEKQKKLTCQICGKVIIGIYRFQRHLRNHKRQPGPSNTCTVCHKVLKGNEKVLQIHMLRHSGVRSYTCEKCAATFCTASDLANHKRKVHDKGLYWYKCDLCDYKAKVKELIKKHKVRHTDSNIPCTVCGMFFESTPKLKSHQRQHFEEKKYVCQHCDMKFYHRNSVNQHVRSKHKCAIMDQTEVKSKSIMLNKKLKKC